MLTTKARIKRIQREVGAYPDGIVGRETLAELEERLGIGAPPERPPDTTAKYPTRVEQSPNWSRQNACDGIVLHHSGSSVSSAVNWCLRKEAGVSYHCIIDTDGKRTQLCEDAQGAWHAGKSSFRGRKWCNRFMLGLAFSGDTNKRALTPEEIESAVEWCLEKMELYGFGTEMVTDHRTVSPGRKNDLSPTEFKRVKDALEAAAAKQ